MKLEIPESFKEYVRSIPDEQVEELARYLNLELKAQVDLLTFVIMTRNPRYNPCIGSRAI